MILHISRQELLKALKLIDERGYSQSVTIKSDGQSLEFEMQNKELDDVTIILYDTKYPITPKISVRKNL